MPFVFGDRVKETTGSTGTGPVVLGGAVSGFQTFASGVGNGNETYYTIVNENDGTWEMGIGTVSGVNFTRDTILSSSNGGLAVSFSAGTKSIFGTVASQNFGSTLDAAAHALIDHTGLPGVPPAEAFTSGVHAGTDHTGLPGVPAAEAFTEPVHALTDHTGFPGIPVTATGGSGGGTQGIVTADTDLGLDLTAGVLSAKLGSKLTFDGGGAIQASHVTYLMNFGVSMSTGSNVWPGIPSNGQAGAGTTGDFWTVPETGTITKAVLYVGTSSGLPLPFFQDLEIRIGSTGGGTAASISVNLNPPAAPGLSVIYTSGTNFPLSVTAGDRLHITMTTFSNPLTTSNYGIILYVET